MSEVSGFQCARLRWHSDVMAAAAHDFRAAAHWHRDPSQANLSLAGPRFKVQTLICLQRDMEGDNMPCASI
jgi:hypothetical protein